MGNVIIIYERPTPHSGSGFPWTEREGEKCGMMVGE